MIVDVDDLELAECGAMELYAECCYTFFDLNVGGSDLAEVFSKGGSDESKDAGCSCGVV